MALFVTRHQHAAETCPAGDLNMGPMLLQHVSKDNAARSGINIHGESVVQGHTFYMIAEASDIEMMREFMEPFTKVGKVEIWEGNSCATVVARRNCGSGGSVWIGGKIS